LGVEADMARLLAARLDRRLEWRVYPEDALVPALRNGEIDMAMAGLAVTPERRSVLDFSRPYLASGLGALARAADASRYPTALDIQSAAIPVGTVRGTHAEAWARRYLPRATVIPFDTRADAATALRDRRIDLLLAEAPSLWSLAEKDPRTLGMAPALVDRTDLAWAFPPAGPTLRESANRALSDWIRDGTLSTLLRLWFPVTR
jgi:ABC-type amino acid transport substrate-binding protein